MTVDEFKFFSAALKTAYPKENLLPSEEAAKLWFEMLRDLDGTALIAALKKWIITEKWPPSIAEIRAKCMEVAAGPLPDWGIAWAEVSKAVHRFGWSRPQEAFASLPALTRDAAERIGWMQICESENLDVLRAQFRQVYEICATRKNEERQLPADLKKLIDGVSNKMLKG